VTSCGVHLGCRDLWSLCFPTGRRSRGGGGPVLERGAPTLERARAGAHDWLGPPSQDARGDPRGRAAPILVLDLYIVGIVFFCWTFWLGRKKICSKGNWEKNPPIGFCSIFFFNFSFAHFVYSFWHTLAIGVSMNWNFLFEDAFANKSIINEILCVGNIMLLVDSQWTRCV
jgi:hypothetical protein